MKNSACLLLLLALNGCVNQQPTAEKQAPPAELSRRMEEARVLEEKGQPETAGEMYRSVREMSLQAHPGVAGLAEWRMSFTSEKVGDDLRAYSHLLSAEGLKAYLPEQIARAELPARKAVLLHRLGHPDEAQAAVREADKGLQFLTSGMRPKPESAWLANLYFDMGDSLSLKINEDSFSDHLKAEEVAQKYLLKAMAQNDPRWSSQALDLLKRQYADYWFALENMDQPAANDTPAMTEKRRQKRISLLAEFSRVLESAKALEPVDVSTANDFEKEFVRLRDSLQDKADKALYTARPTIRQTDESKKLNGVRRDVRLIDPPQTKKSDKDPNL